MRISVSVEALSSDRSSQVLGGNKTSYYVGKKKHTECEAAEQKIA